MRQVGRLEAPVVLAGDFKCAHNKDIYQAGPGRRMLCCSRKAATASTPLDQGWTDAVRIRHPDEPDTFWDYKRTAGSVMPDCASISCC
jgi:exonuclease III